eukprot:TRINITY_DN3656_c0_g2_i1.p1 TRINITY_DN3656_c0_g2~~TRINITY_DN3656_c0_g2_i1.p1  ORF type:complete len:391 (+),score=55.67 TRINITY_DN3656_c0_g2_i1:158-1174(+)
MKATRSDGVVVTEAQLSLLGVVLRTFGVSTDEVSWLEAFINTERLTPVTEPETVKNGLTVITLSGASILTLKDMYGQAISVSLSEGEIVDLPAVLFCSADGAAKVYANTTSLPSDHPRVLIPELCSKFYKLGWVSGTGGGISMRYEGDIYVAPSGVQKERIKAHQLFVLNEDGSTKHSPATNPPLKLSACTPLFMNAYRHRNAGAVIHSHSVNAMMVTLLFSGPEFRVTHLEMIKGIQGHEYYDDLVIPIIDNTAFEHELTESMEAAMLAYPRAPAVLVRRHGVYVWGKNWVQAKTQSECLEFLFQAALRMKSEVRIWADEVPEGTRWTKEREERAQS